MSIIENKAKVKLRKEDNNKTRTKTDMIEMLQQLVNILVQNTQCGTTRINIINICYIC